MRLSARPPTLCGMSTIGGSLRRLALAPSLAEVTFARRGFPGTAISRLEAIPQAVICGFEWGIDARRQWEVERRLSLVDQEMRGFAYEGATMAFTILDMMRGGRGRRTRDLLLGPGQPHIFLAYIGIGFAMARLPRILWKRVIPDLSGGAYYPTMSWLAVDGYGFDRAYFDTRRWVDEQYVPPPYPWEGSPDYFLRVVDQGIGRALWFIHGASAPEVAAAVGRFAEHRQADLWSGVGLASAFAGGCSPEELSVLRAAAGEFGAELAQGVVFAVKARSFAGFVPDHTRQAGAIMTGLPVEDAVALADDAAAEDGRPAYEQWRKNVREHFVAADGVKSH
jgi:enediyne biosynthesis protein E2